MAPKADLALSEVISALSYALDLADGQPLGHAVRSCVIGMRLADELGLTIPDRGALFYGLLLKDAGCSSNAARITALYGADDLTAKRNARTINHSRLPEALRYIVRNAHGLRGLARVLRAGSATARELTEIRCERGAEIARMLDLPEAAAEAIYALDEHWDGKGHPLGLAGSEIPLLARILCVAQTVEVFLSRHGLDAACEMAIARSETWFDPALVCALLTLRDDHDFWESVTDWDVLGRIAALEPVERRVVADDEHIDRVAAAFARVIDAKSPYTFRHSERVAELAVGIAQELSFDAAAVRDVRRAGLLHDIGKLGISNLILDKAGPLTDEEYAEVRRHPYYGDLILRKVAAFDALSDAAAAHHERLDGTGYHRGLTGDALSPAARVLAVADVFEAMTADRPYRPAMSVEEALQTMRREVGTRLCPAAFAGLERSLGSSRARIAAAA